MPVSESGNKLTEIMAHNLKEQQSAGHHPVIPAVDHTPQFSAARCHAHNLKEQRSAGHQPVIPAVHHTPQFSAARCHDAHQERAKWRTECREKLASHIHSYLGLTILPTDVKLITKPEDLYQWSILTAGKAALFNKQLSKHSTGAYIDLCNEVGVHFKAVLGKGAADYDRRFETDLCARDFRGRLQRLEEYAMATMHWRHRNEARLF
ncbi:hypothetical protein V502_00437 [Pseudogymnoascus sp. VKM F-4520 (FW-2644)]|nr:hypothetical protein V502_00437 [Pseudogymnoascus sp. VKM F-4520 (FW-2644)]